MLLLDGEDAFHQAPGRRVVVAEIADDLPVGLDRDALGDQVLLEHVDESRALDVLGVAPRREAVGGEVRLAVELRDALGDLVGVLLLLVGVLEELLRDRLRVDARGHEVVPLVAEHADDLRRQRLVQDLDDRLAVGAVALGHRPLLHMLPRSFPKRLDVRKEGPLRGKGRLGCQLRSGSVLHAELSFRGDFPARGRPREGPL